MSEKNVNDEKPSYFSVLICHFILHTNLILDFFTFFFFLRILAGNLCGNKKLKIFLVLKIKLMHQQ